MADEMDEGMDVAEAPQNDLLTVLLVIAFVFLIGGVYFMFNELGICYECGPLK